MSTFIPLFFATPLTILSTNILYLLSQSIPKLQKYEETSRKAAKWSNTAEEQRRKTTASMSVGVVSALMSLLSALTLLITFFWTFLSQYTILILILCNTLVIFFAHQYLNSFWKAKVKVPLPGSGDYNDAVGINADVVRYLGYLGVGWGGFGSALVVMRLVVGFV